MLESAVYLRLPDRLQFLLKVRRQALRVLPTALRAVRNVLVRLPYLGLEGRTLADGGVACGRLKPYPCLLPDVRPLCAMLLRQGKVYQWDAAVRYPAAALNAGAKVGSGVEAQAAVPADFSIRLSQPKRKATKSIRGIKAKISLIRG